MAHNAESVAAVPLAEPHSMRRDEAYTRVLETALFRLVDALWSEFGRELVEGEDDDIDRAYKHGCDVLGLIADPRTQMTDNQRRAYHASLKPPEK